MSRRLAQGSKDTLGVYIPQPQQLSPLLPQRKNASEYSHTLNPSPPDDWPPYAIRINGDDTSRESTQFQTTISTLRKVSNLMKMMRSLAFEPTLGQFAGPHLRAKLLALEFLRATLCL
jgi:hypothetical protein